MPLLRLLLDTEWICLKWIFPVFLPVSYYFRPFNAAGRWKLLSGSHSVCWAAATLKRPPEGVASKSCRMKTFTPLICGNRPVERAGRARRRQEVTNKGGVDKIGRSPQEELIRTQLFLSGESESAAQPADRLIWNNPGCLTETQWFIIRVKRHIIPE